LKATPKNIATASNILKRGGVVIYPTETVYGLGCDPFNIKAVRRIFRIKGERKKPFPVLACDISDVKRIAELSERDEKIAERFWPGPLTLVLPKKPTLPDIVTCNLKSVGVRMPKHKVALELICTSNRFLVGTSANKTGRKPPKTAQEAKKQVGQKVDFILDGGPACLGKPSTILDLTSIQPKILREGSVELDEIMEVVKCGQNV
jgi:L-threonylcarbamoyladenylate synthase